MTTKIETIPNAATLELLIEIHIYGEPIDLANSSDTVKRAHAWLLKNGLIVARKIVNPAESQFTITERAGVFLEHIMETPLPVSTQVWSIPSREA